MKKIKIDLFWCIILGFVFISTVGCEKKSNVVIISDDKQQPTIIEINTKPQNNNKKSNLDNSIILRMEIDEIKNKKIKDIVEDKNETLKNGIYGCISNAENRYYILINGVDYWYSNISFSFKDKVLSISYDTNYNKGLRNKQFFVINPNNQETFDTVELINNGKKETFKILFQH
jgi:hypothetical protein